MKKYVKVFVGHDGKFLGQFHTQRFMELEFKTLYQLVRDFFGTLQTDELELTFEFTDEDGV